MDTMKGLISTKKSKLKKLIAKKISTRKKEIEMYFEDCNEQLQSLFICLSKFHYQSINYHVNDS